MMRALAGIIVAGPFQAVLIIAYELHVEALEQALGSL